MAARARRDAEPTIWRIPDDLWLIVRHVLPPGEQRRSRGRPWIDSRRIVDGVLYVLRTGCQWKAVPREYGSGSTVHRRFQPWCRNEILRQVLTDIANELRERGAHRAGNNLASASRLRSGRTRLVRLTWYL